MRRICKLIALTLPPVATAFADTLPAVLDLQNKTCSLCGMTVKKALQKVPGVDDAVIDYPFKTVPVKYDVNKENVASQVKATTNAGFPSTPRR